MPSKTAQIAGPTPANRLVTRTAAKDSTNGAPVPVKDKPCPEGEHTRHCGDAEENRNMVFWNGITSCSACSAKICLTPSLQMQVQIYTVYDQGPIASILLIE